MMARGADPVGGGKRIRTADPLLAKQVLYQLSYTPELSSAVGVVGLGRFELPTSSLSGTRSNQLSYRPRSAVFSGALSFRSPDDPSAPAPPALSSARLPPWPGRFREHQAATARVGHAGDDRAGSFTRDRQEALWLGSSLKMPKPHVPSLDGTV